VAGTPVSKLITAIGVKFCKEVIFADPEDFSRLLGKPVLYLANHQTYVESPIFSVILNALGQIDLVPLAKKEHRDLWIGKFQEVFLSYPNLPQSSQIFFIDKDKQEELFQVFSKLEAQLREKHHSILVHVEGTRARRANQPIKKLSNVLIDLSLKAGVPIVPVRFRGGLPLLETQTTTHSKFDFPSGYGRQSYWIGKTLRPADLEGLPYAQRTSHVRDAINQLGGIDDEFPEPADEVFGENVTLWRNYAGAAEAPAVIFQALLGLDPLPVVPEQIGTHVVDDPWSRFLLAGSIGQKLRRPTALILPDNEIGRWIRNLALWLFATGGPRVFLGETPGKEFEIIFSGSDHA
jgi:1-acyl-sn-glycerol-3-phosphate acyltransferase